jgi:hypothetical protein
VKEKYPFVVVILQMVFLSGERTVCAGEYTRETERGEQDMKKLIGIVLVTLISLSAFAGEKRFSVPIGDSPSTGPMNAPVTIIEFLDFQ